jgi:hypothetical protein
MCTTLLIDACRYAHRNLDYHWVGTCVRCGPMLGCGETICVTSWLRLETLAACSVLSACSLRGTRLLHVKLSVALEKLATSRNRAMGTFLCNDREGAMSVFTHCCKNQLLCAGDSVFMRIRCLIGRILACTIWPHLVRAFPEFSGSPFRFS